MTQIATQTKEPSTEKKKLFSYRPDIEGLRGIAAIAIIIFHVNKTLLPSGFIGVDIFFVISGYVVTASILRHQSAGIIDYLTGFYQRRVLRLIPTLLACILATTLLSALFVRPDTLTDALSVGKWALLGWSNNYLIDASNDYFGLGTELNPFVHTWALGVEQQFYFVFPILLALIYGLRRPAQNRRLALRVLLALVACSGALSLLFTQTDLIRAYYSTLSRFWEIAAGALLCSAVVVWPNFFSRLYLSSRPWLLQLGAIGLLAIAFALTPAAPGFPMPWAILTVAGTLLFISAGFNPSSRLNRAVSHPFLTYVGGISYSLYLWHWPVFVLFRWTIGINSTFKALAALAVTVAIALVSYYLLEQPARKLKGMDYRKVFVIALVGIFVVGTSNVAIAKPLQGSLYLYREYNSSDWEADANQILIEGTQISRKNCKTDPKEKNPAIAQQQFIACTLPGTPASKPHIFMVGDSHAEGLIPMFEEVAEGTGIGITTVFARGCLFSQHVLAAGEDNQCNNYAKNLLNLIEEKSKPDDIVLVISRYTAYLIDSSPIPLREQERYDKQGYDQYYRDGKPISKAAARRYVAQEYAETATRLKAKGVKFIVQAPLPEYFARADQCLPVWFSASSGLKPECFTTRASNLEQRRPVIDMLQAAQRSEAEVYVWDAFDRLCPSNECLHFSNNKPLVYDDNHLSVYGSRSLANDFIGFLQRNQLI